MASYFTSLSDKLSNLMSETEVRTLGAAVAAGQTALACPVPARAVCGGGPAAGALTRGAQGLWACLRQPGHSLTPRPPPCALPQDGKPAAPPAASEEDSQCRADWGLTLEEEVRRRGRRRRRRERARRGAMGWSRSAAGAGAQGGGGRRGP